MLWAATLLCRAVPVVSLVLPCAHRATLPCCAVVVGTPCCAVVAQVLTVFDGLREQGPHDTQTAVLSAGARLVAAVADQVGRVCGGRARWAWRGWEGRGGRGRHRRG